MASGTVGCFSPTKGYGFTESETGSEDVLVHTSAARRAGARHFGGGQKLRSEVEQQQDGRAAAGPVLQNSAPGP